jgi:hypothetical protein
MNVKRMAHGMTIYKGMSATAHLGRVNYINADRLYVYGGFNGGAPLKSVEMLEPSRKYTTTWTVLSSTLIHADAYFASVPVP